MTKKRIVKISDFNRVILSETSPYDVPLIFSNNFFYDHMTSYESSSVSNKIIIEKLFLGDMEKYYSPIKYPILKGDNGCRYLTLLHPSSQMQIVEIYKAYSKRIIHHCSIGKFSIRRPTKIASSYSVKSPISENKAFRLEGASTVSDEKKYKHCTSYFSYHPHTKLHQFFESSDYLNLESKFTQFVSIDISKCFDSIYTHSVTWAVKSKQFSKSTTNDTNFSNILDRSMQRSNYNETNGIVIGNEFSRIFAEIILQAIDKSVEDAASLENLELEKDYVIRRYVDDYFIFTNSDHTANKIIALLEENLRKYKFHLNTSKTKKKTRPLITGITRAKIHTNEAIKEIFEIIFERREDSYVVSKNVIRSPDAVVRKFLNLVMNSCYEDYEAYIAMCGYVISAILNRLKIVDFQVDKDKRENIYNCKNTIFVLLKVAFHLFNMSPNSANSVKISLICYLSVSSFESTFPDEAETIKLMVSDFVKKFFESGKFSQLRDRVQAFAPIEFSNILCVARNLCPDLTLPPNVVKEAFSLEALTSRAENYLSSEESCDYFQIMSALYYCGNNSEYDLIRKDLIKNITKRLSDVQTISTDARICYLFLDSMSCPYIEIKQKRTWFELFYKTNNLTTDKSEELKIKLFKTLTENNWFISWDRLELWNILERKELLFGY